MEPDKNLEQEVAKRLAELPADIKAAIESADLATHIHDIGEKNKLHIDQVGTLEDEIYLSMLGFSRTDEFAKNIEKRLNVSAEQAAAITKDADEQIFLAIRESMKKFAEAKAAPVAPLPQPLKEIEPPPMPAAEAMLAAPTITPAVPASPASSPTPKPYTQDPYREPVE
jgi:hypothetical protein